MPAKKGKTTDRSVKNGRTEEKVMSNELKNVLLVVSGPSGSGKNTLLSYILENRPDSVHSVSATTRAPRFFEHDGVDYYFKTTAEFERLIDEGGLIEWDKYRGNYYGTLVSDVQRKIDEGLNVVFDITIPGAENVKRLFPNATKTVFVLPPSIRILRHRLVCRKSDDEETINRRIEFAIRSEIEKYRDFDYVLVNDDLDEARKNILAIYDSLTKPDCENTAAAACFKKDAFAEHAEETIKRIHEEVMNDSFQNNA